MKFALQRRKIVSAYDGGPLRWETIDTFDDYLEADDQLRARDTDPAFELSLVDTTQLAPMRRPDALPRADASAGRARWRNALNGK